jgi:hypothetical protein
MQGFGILTTLPTQDSMRGRPADLASDISTSQRAESSAQPLHIRPTAGQPTRLRCCAAHELASLGACCVILRNSIVHIDVPFCSRGAQVPSECNRRSEKVEKADEAYFDSYGYFDIHRTMLEDKVGPSTQCHCRCPLL